MANRMSMRPSNTPRFLLGIAAALTVTAAIAVAVAVGNLFVHEQPAMSPSAVRPPADTTLSASASFTPHEHPRPMPELKFVDGDGRNMTLADFRGRVVLLNVWATWCVPCRKEMPTLDRLQAKLGSPDFQVVALSIDRAGVPVVKQFYQELGLKALGIYVDQPGTAAASLGTLGIPTTVLVDRDGQEVARKVGPADWDSPEIIALIRHQLAPQSGSASAAGLSPAGATAK